MVKSQKETPIRRTRLAARREAMGFSQRSLAEHLGVNLSTVQRWESGETTPKAATRSRYARALQISTVELVQMLNASSDSGAPAGSLEVAPADLVHRSPASMNDGGDVHRRDFLQGLAGAGLAVAAPILAPKTPNPVASLRADVERAMRFEQRAQYAALSASLPGLVTHAHAVAADTEGKARLEADRLLTSALLVQAFVLVKHDRPSDATVAATNALTIAEQSTDPVLVGASFRCLSETHMRGGDYDLAADLGIEGATYLERADPISPSATAVRGACLLSAATARARAGDRRGAYELLQAAQVQAERLGTDVVGTVVFGPTNVAIHHVVFEVELGDPTQALKFANSMRVDEGRGLEERRSRYLIDVARAHTARRQDTEALEALLSAEMISPEETRAHRFTHSTLIDLVERRPARMSTALVPLAQRCGVLEAA